MQHVRQQFRIARAQCLQEEIRDIGLGNRGIASQRITLPVDSRG